MVSYRQLESGQVVFHERETTSSGRPKPTHGIEEDEDYFYTYTRTGEQTKIPKHKTPFHNYIRWYESNVKFNKNNCRITPLTDFEKAIGIRSCIPTYRYKHCSCGERCGCATSNYNEDEWEKFMQTHSIDWGEVSTWYDADKPNRKIANAGTYANGWEDYFRKKAKEQNLEVVSIQELEFREKQKPAVVEKVRPNPKEQSIASVKIEKPEPVEIEPIKEAVKYSPLMIAGVIAVVVILLLKRRRA